MYMSAMFVVWQPVGVGLVKAERRPIERRGPSFRSTPEQHVSRGFGELPSSEPAIGRSPRHERQRAWRPTDRGDDGNENAFVGEARGKDFKLLTRASHEVS